MKYLIMFLLLITVVAFVYYLLKAIEENKAISKSVQKIFKASSESVSKRKQIEIKYQQEDGNKEKNNFLYDLDLMLERSEIKKYIPFLNTEIYIILTIIIGLLAFILIQSVLNHWIFGFLGTMVVGLISYSILYFFSGINYERIEDEITTFVNMLENYSVMYDDILTIMKKSYVHLNNPLREYIEEFCDETESSGDIERAFSNLETKLENPRFKKLIRNINICSKHEANYKEIIKDERRSLRRYQRERNSRKATVSTGRIEIGIIIGCGIVIVGMFTSFVPNLYSILLTTGVGNLLLLYMIIVLGIAILTLVAFDKK
ncbi:MAG: hypothetical protein ACLR3R_18620 [Clostridium paraputrificum]